MRNRQKEFSREWESICEIKIARLIMELADNHRENRMSWNRIVHHDRQGERERERRTGQTRIGPGQHMIETNRDEVEEQVAHLTSS
jgi:hypothetical protein